MKLHTGFVLAIALLGVMPAAWAQSNAPHPLRPASAPPPATQPPAPARAEPPLPTRAAPPAKAKRPRSPAQLANDERMRACGKEWRAQKEALKAQGLTWYRFSAECRKRLKGVRI